MLISLAMTVQAFCTVSVRRQCACKSDITTRHVPRHGIMQHLLGAGSASAQAHVHYVHMGMCTSCAAWPWQRLGPGSGCQHSLLAL
jgi:hypothetical protein